VKHRLQRERPPLRSSVISRAVGLSILTLTVASPARAQTLYESVQASLANSPALDSQRQQIAAQKERKNQALSLRRATVQGEASAASAARVSRQQGFAGTLPATYQGSSPTNITLTAEQALYTGGRAKASFDVADVQVRQAEARLRSIEGQIIQGVVTAWADVRSGLGIVAIRQETIQSLNEQLVGARERFRLGEASLTDVSQAESRLAAERSASATAVANLAGSQATYSRYVGDLALSPTDQGQQPELPASLSAAIDHARGVNPELISAKLEETLARARRREAATESNGRVVVQASISGGTDQGFPGNRSSNAQVSARYTVPLWSGGQAPSRAREAERLSEAALSRSLDIERQVIERVSTAWARSIAAREAIAASREQVSAAVVALRGARAEFLFGLRDQLAVLNQLAELSNAKIQLLNAENEALVNYFAIFQAIGSLDGTSFFARKPESIIAQYTEVADPALWEEPLIRVQRVLERNTDRVERVRARGTRAVFGPEQ
jgi:outer membrane protein